MSLTQLTDQLGSVIRQINAAGATQSSTAYSPYGEAITTIDDQYNNTEYTGRENDETGLYFYRARYYDPVLKRFVSEDPIGTQGGINVYGYVGGNPISNIDPEGKNTIALGAGGGAVIAGPPGAVVGAVIGGVVLVGAVIYAMCKDDKCPPCVERPPRIDRVPPSGKHWPCPGDHMHTYTVSGQGPPPACKCSYKETVSCL